MDVWNGPWPMKWSGRAGVDHTWRGTPSGLQTWLEKRGQRTQTQQSEQRWHSSAEGSKKILRRVLGHGKKRPPALSYNLGWNFERKELFIIFFTFFFLVQPRNSVCTNDDSCRHSAHASFSLPNSLVSVSPLSKMQNVFFFI